MRLFRTFARRFPVVLTAPNPVARERRLALCLDLCQNHEIYVRGRGRYEAEWIRLVAAGMADADRFVDVGANVGAYALSIAQAFPDRQVIAVEPLPDAQAALARGIELNGLRNVRIVRGVVADATGPTAFHVNPLSDGAGSLAPIHEYRTGDIAIDADAYRREHPDFVGTVTVDATPLDALIDVRSVVKIDVEGAEEAVLRSGRRAVEKGLVDVIVIEVQSDTFAPVVRMLDEMDFDAFLYGRRRPLSPDDAARLPYRVGNLLALRRGSAAHARVDFD